MSALAGARSEAASAKSFADALTVAALGILAYMLDSVLHEGVGHGGACVLTGGHAIGLSSVYFECSAETRLVMAGGTLVNLIAGAVFFLFGRWTRREHAHWKYFCWLAMTINLYAGTGYFLFSGIGGMGDWGEFIQGLGPQWAWRIGLTLLGAVSYLLAARISLPELRALIGSGAERFQRGMRLSAIPYFAGGILMCLAGALNPKGAILILISAAASTFGGSSGLLWATQWLRGGGFIPFGSMAEPVPITRSWRLVAASAVTAVVFVAVLGRGIQFVQ